VGGRRKACEQEEHGKSVVEITKGIDKGWVSLLDQVVESHARRILFQSRGIADFIAAECAPDLLCQSLVLAEFVEERFVEEVLDVFGIVECG